jgi:hypothetical protein
VGGSFTQRRYNKILRNKYTHLARNEYSLVPRKLDVIAKSPSEFRLPRNIASDVAGLLIVPAFTRVSRA